MERVTETLLLELDVEIHEQRLDSTHVFSNMAAWTRKRLLFQIVQRFLNQVRRHGNDRYHRIDCAFRERYERDNGWIFAETSPMKLSRNGKVFTTEEQLGYDMEKLIGELHSEEKFTNMTSYKDLVRVFQEQFVDHDGKAELKEHPGGKILVNPSDREAEIGHKGVGYQAQVTETSSPENDVQLVTSVIVQGGSESDMNSLPEVVEKLEEDGLLPEKLLADQGYGSDENYVKCAENEVELMAPAPPKPTGKIGLEECEFDLAKKMTRCPAGNKPMKKEYFRGKGRAVFHKNVCEKCPLREKCRVRKCGKQNYAFFYTDADLRTAERRRFETTESFKNEYRRRSGIEGLFGSLKQFTPLRRLRVRGRSAVSHSIYMIFAMHNVMQAARYFKIRTRKALAGGLFAFFMRIFRNHCNFLILQAQ
ncbi:MAG: Transposase DDE domain protein [Lentisphaerae bacterium ADurb.Bin242]|nr:MAG: Transposase DDE domain protein [Lentisphaerae bacterium ADurb.Bin242]